MKNYIQPSDALTVTAPNATADVDVSSGDGVLVGTMFGVAVNDAVKGAELVINTLGVFELPKVSAQAWTVGAKIYWDNTAKKCTTTSGGNSLIGVATAVAANPSAVGHVRLNGISI